MKNISTDDALVKYGNELRNDLYFVFPESRTSPLKWFDSIPEYKLENHIRHGYYSLSARPGEVMIYQLGVWAMAADLNDVRIAFYDLNGRKDRIRSARMTCYNMGGIDFRGRPFTKVVNIPKGRVQALWIGIDLDSIPGGTYRGKVSVMSNGEEESVPILLRVSGDPVPDHGYDHGSDLSRLNWLNSTAGMDHKVTKGFSPVTMDGNRILISGRTMEIADNGLPAAVTSYFGPSNQTLTSRGEPVISRPFRFIAEEMERGAQMFYPGKLEITHTSASAVAWRVVNKSGANRLKI